MLPYIVGAGVGIIGLAWYLKRHMKKSVDIKIPAGTVILRDPAGRCVHVPSASPYVVKLETYLRMANIPYKSDFSAKMSSKNKVPWITLDGVDVDDSQFCIEFLNNRFKVDLSSKLSPLQKAEALAFRRLTEDNLYWGVTHMRWVTCTDFIDEQLFAKLPNLLRWYIKRKFANQTYSQGMGRHTPEEVDQIVEKDLRAISVFLGDKKFLMGDEPCEEDATVFGMLSQVKWQLPGTAATKLLNEELLNLSDYCERMKQTFWPDWKEHINCKD